MYCPQCTAEYRPGFTTCADCGVPLVADHPPAAVPALTGGVASVKEVFLTSDPLHADLVSATLQEHGIEALVRTRLAGGLTLTATETHWAPGQSRVVLVPTLVYDRACALLESIASPSSETEDPRDSTATAERTDTRRVRAKVVATIVLAPVLASLAYGVYMALGELLRPPTPTSFTSSVPQVGPSRAVRVLRAECNAGKIAACVNLGVAYEKGEGVSPQPARAAALYRLGCDSGVPVACVNLGRNYETGSGVPVNVGEAVRLYQRACDAGAMPGCYTLGTAYQRGVGVEVDLPRAAQLFSRACYRGYPYACVSLAYCYRTGSGAPKSSLEAVRLYRRACDAREMHGCYNLGVSYQRGEGVDQDPAEAMRLYKLACEGGYALGCAVNMRE